MVPVAVVGGDQSRPVIVSDGAGGAIIAWWDDRNGSLGIYAQRLDADGNPMWTPNGIQVASSVDFAAQLLEKVHVAVTPGDAFGTNDHVRISYATSIEQLDKGMKRMHEFIGGLL